MKVLKLDLPYLWRKFSVWLLALSWVSGLLLGALAANASKDILTPLIYGSVLCDASILGLLCASLLPFLLSAFAVFLSEPWLLLIISTFKAFSFSFCASGVSLAFGQSSWLVRFLFLFSDLCLVPVLCIYWLRHISGRHTVRQWELPACLCAAAVVSCIDYCFIAPFLVSLMEK